MRVSFKDPIVHEIARMIYEARSNYKEIEAIYLSQEEWYKLMDHFRGEVAQFYACMPPQKVSVIEPCKLSYVEDYHTYAFTRTRYDTEEVEFMGVKIRRDKHDDR